MSEMSIDVKETESVKYLSIIKKYYRYVLKNNLSYTHKDSLGILYHFCDIKSKGFNILISVSESAISYTDKLLFIQYSCGIKHGIECIYDVKENKLEMIEYNFNNEKTKDFNESIKIFINILNDFVYSKDLTSIVYEYIA